MAPPPRPAWQKNLSRFFARPAVELTVGGLVILSVILTLLEFAVEVSPEESGDWLFLPLANDAITAIFALELTLRYLAAASKRQFFSEYWLDIIAVLPIFRVFRAARAVRLLRLIRLLRLFGVVNRLASHFPYVLRRGAVEYLVVCGLLVMTVVFATGAMLLFESGSAGADGPGFNLERSFWFSVYSLFAGEPVPGPPQTLGGKIVAVFVMFMGLTIFAMFTGTVSAFMVQRFQQERHIMNLEDLHDHVILCGWNSRAEIIIAELRSAPSRRDSQIVVIAQFEHEKPLLTPELERYVRFLSDDFTRVVALEQAGIHRARTCIILADTTGGRSEQDADARTILAALTVEKLNGAVYTCAELHNRQYGSHLKMGNVNDYVVTGESSAYMLAQSVLHRGLMGVFSELLTYQRGNEFYRTPLPESFIGRSFAEVLSELKSRHDVILVGVYSAAGETLINPTAYTIAPGDEAVVIARKEFSIS